VSIGTTLAAARESAGLTLEDVAAKTRIRRTLILGMENDNFSACGGDFYARGHLRTVATAVGLDPAPLLAEFDAERPAAAPARATDVFEPEINAPAERRGPNWTAAMAAALVLVVGFGIVHAFTGSDKDNARVSNAAGSSSAPASRPSKASPSPSTDDGSAVAQAPRGKVTVVVKATDRSWVQVTTNTGQELFQGLLQDGQQKSFADKTRLKLVIGNAGGVDLTVNGSEIGAPGKRGQVARVQFTPEDSAAG
jgi:cytoskeleton protein RodZ